MVPQNGCFIMENPIKIHDLGGVPLFLGNIHILDIINTNLYPKTQQIISFLPARLYPALQHP